MTKQNRTLGFVTLLIAVVLIAVIYRSGKFNSSDSPAMGIEVKDQSNPESQDSMGDIVKEGSTTAPSAPTSEDKQKFIEMINSMMTCLDIKGSVPAAESPVSIDTILQAVQPELGESAGVFDRWMYWHLNTPEGQERRLRMEVSENDEGQIIKELHYFNIDKSGQPIPLELAPEVSRNPNDDVIKDMLKDGEVFYKERGAAVLFAGGEHLEFIEKNDLLSELEFQKGTSLYRCQGFKSLDSCQCVK